MLTCFRKNFEKGNGTGNFEPKAGGHTIKEILSKFLSLTGYYFNLD